jgi:hypothetical protein
MTGILQCGDDWAGSQGLSKVTAPVISKLASALCAEFLSVPVKVALVELREKVTIFPSTAVKATEVSPAVTVPAMSIAVGRLKQAAAPAWGPKAV